METKKISDEDILRHVEEAYEAGETDLLDGGVAAQTVAERIDAGSLSFIRKRLNALADGGRLERVDGIPPEALGDDPSAGVGPRQSYKPL